MQSSLTGFYSQARRTVRSVVLQHSMLNATIGQMLRRLERMFPLQRLYVGNAGKVSCHGLTWDYTDRDHGVVMQLQLNGDYEPETRQVIQTILKPGMTFVDLGAHIGYFSLLAAQAVTETGRVFAFEPTTETRNTLTANGRANGLADRITIERFAISEKPGKVRFACEQSSTSNKIISSEQSAERSVEVDSISLDEYFKSRQWPNVDLIKMDIEGAELPALRGMRELSERNPKLKLIFEFLHQHLVDHDVSPTMIFDQLTALGFRQFRVIARDAWQIRIPDDLARLQELAKRVNLNILAER